MRNHHVLVAALVAGIALAGTGYVPHPIAATAHAQDSTSTPPGVAPRRRSHHRRSRTPAVVVSFPGFHLNPDGTSRCFVHVAGSITPESNASARRFEIRLPNASVAARNHMNPLETQFFNTPMIRARLVRRGRTDLVFVVELRADVAVSMRTEADPNGGKLVIVDLPAGNYVTSPPHVRDEWERDADSVPPTARGSASVRPSASSEPPAPSTSTGTPPPSTTTPPPSSMDATGNDPPPSTTPAPRRPDPERPPMFN